MFVLTADLVPALQHDVVEGGWAALWLLHPEPVLNLVQHLQQGGENIYYIYTIICIYHHLYTYIL